MAWICIQFERELPAGAYPRELPVGAYPRELPAGAYPHELSAGACPLHGHAAVYANDFAGDVG